MEPIESFMGASNEKTDDAGLRGQKIDHRDLGNCYPSITKSDSFIVVSIFDDCIVRHHEYEDGPVTTQKEHSPEWWRAEPGQVAIVDDILWIAHFSKHSSRGSIHLVEDIVHLGRVE